MTLDEAIKHCLDIADGQDKCAEISVSEHAKERISQCAADHRQLAAWLTEFKQLKAIIAGYDDVNMQKLEMVLAMIRIGSEDAWTKIEREKELKEAKRLLKAAVEDMEQANQKGRCSTCIYNLHNAKGLIGKCQACHYFSLWKWRNEAEALALIGEDGEQNEKRYV